MSLEYYWTLTPKQFEKYAKVYHDKEKERVEEIDYMNFLLGKYIAYACNDPKKYPNKPFLQDNEEETRDMSLEELERQARLNTIKMGGVVK